jgi:hypothetical protein
VRWAVEAAKDVTLSYELQEGIEDAAEVASRGRASVPRDSSWKREVEGRPEPEEPIRIAKQLGLLARVLLAIGLSDEEALSFVSRMALDSMPGLRRRVLADALTREGRFTAADVARTVRCSWKVADRALEDFELLGLVERAERNSWEAVAGAANGNHWRVVAEEVEVLRAVIDRSTGPVLGKSAGEAGDEKSTLTPSPPEESLVEVMGESSSNGTDRADTLLTDGLTTDEGWEHVEEDGDD